MAAFTPTTINNPIENTVDRDEVVWNHNAGALVFDNTTAKQRVHLTHRSGANWYMNDRVVSTFSPNDIQELAQGNAYKTTKGDAFFQTHKNAEHRTFGDFTIITGSPNFLDKGIAQDYVENNRALAVAKSSPEVECAAEGNNSGAVFQDKGTPNEKSGAVDGGSYPKNAAQQNTQKLMEDATSANTELERMMGTGGNIKLMSCKHIMFIAGTAAVNYDSGVTITKGKSVTQKYDFKDGKAVETQTAVPVYETKDTSSAMPFGDIHFNACSKINLQSGSGGVNIVSSGNTNINTTGRLELGGAEVSIGGGTKGGGGRVSIITDKDIFMESDVLITQHAANINTVADSQYTIVTPLTFLTNDCHIHGNLRVQGNLHVEGDITCNGGTGVSVPNGDVVASGISLVKHVHTEQGDGNDVSKPK